MKTDDPWSGIVPPTKAASVNALRVGESLRWDLYWALDLERNCLLILQHGIPKNSMSRLPKFKGLQVDTHSVDGARHRLMLRLLDGDQREIFHRLCLDIVSAIETAQTEEQAVQRFLNRTWRWHRLLKGVTGGRLRPEEQRGLFGELIFLEEHLMPILGTSQAVRSWRGPLGSPRDFEIGRVSVEVKTIQNATTPRVAISSGLQLDSSETDILFLFVAEVSRADDQGPQAKTITQLAARIKSKIADGDPSLVDEFEDLLAAAGFDWQEDYSDCFWSYGSERQYRVEEGFPRVTPSMHPPGVENLRYSVLFAFCEQFRVEKQELSEAILQHGCIRQH